MPQASFSFREQGRCWKRGFAHPDCKIHAEGKTDLPAELGEKFGRRGWEARAPCAPAAARSAGEDPGGRRFIPGSAGRRRRCA